MKEFADWGHVLGGNITSVYSYEGLNGVRPGDLQAVLNVYFECSCGASRVGNSEIARLSERRKRELLDLGFHQDELFTNMLSFRCKRRPHPIDEHVICSLQLYKPPLDGSYTSLPLEKCKKS